MGNSEYNNLGENIKSIVQDAVNRMDYKQLNLDIKDTVNQAIHLIRAEMDVTKNIEEGNTERWKSIAEDSHRAHMQMEQQRILKEKEAREQEEAAKYREQQLRIHKEKVLKQQEKEARMQEQFIRHQEQALKKQEMEVKQREQALIKRQDEARRREEFLRKKQEETKQQEEYLRQKQEQAKQHVKALYEQEKEAAKHKNQVIQYHYQRPQEVVKNPPAVVNKRLIRKPSLAGAVVAMVFGSLGVASFSVGFILFQFILLYGHNDPVLVWLIRIMGFLAAGSGFLLARGISGSKTVSRYKRYIAIIGNRTWCDIKELAVVSRVKVPKVKKDLCRMIDRHIFPLGRLDEEGTCLMLDNQSYQHYVDAKNALLLRQKQEEDERRLLQEDPNYARIAEALEEGQEYIRKIHIANDEIPGIEISDKLSKLELILLKIFEHLKNNPDKLSEMRKFMSYYLPTTLKLVEAYRDLDKQEIVGENIVNAKREIRDTLDTINEAFVTLFDSLFMGRAMDISSDISVLNAMLVQEGLTKSDWNLPVQFDNT